MIIEIIRHGETTLQAMHKYQGATDAHLSDDGKERLCMAEVIPQKIYITKLSRTKETAEIIFPGAELIPVSGLEEMNFGDFEGRSASEMENDEAYTAWVNSFCTLQCPNGEDRESFENRVCASLLALIEKCDKAGEKKITIVAHGGVQMAVGDKLIPESGKQYWEWQLKSGEGWVYKTNGNYLKVTGKTIYHN